MTECIKNAKNSIYIISDLSRTEESEMDEHKNYIAALNRVMDGNKGNPNFKVKRIVVPPSDIGIDRLRGIYDLFAPSFALFMTALADVSHLRDFQAVLTRCLSLDY